MNTKFNVGAPAQATSMPINNNDGINNNNTINTSNAAPNFQYGSQKSGRSAARLIEDILRLIPDQQRRYMLLSSVEMSKCADICAQPLNYLAVIDASPEPFVVQSLDGRTVSLYAIMTNNLHHLEINIHHKVTPSIEADLFQRNFTKHDFHLDLVRSVSNNSNYTRQEVYYFTCSLTGTVLNITIRPPEFTDLDLQDFTEEAIALRFAKFHEAKPTASKPSPAQCFQTLFKIIDQPLSSNEPRDIRMDNPTLNMKINPKILYKLGFILDTESRSFVPPNLFDYENPQTISERRKASRRLLEVACRAYACDGKHHNFPFRLQPILKSIQAQLGLKEVYFHEPTERLSGSFDGYSNYVVLGAGEVEDDESLVKRYELQSQNDPENAPQYLDALKALSELRRSEILQIKVVELVSLGFVVAGDISKAYQTFGLDPSTDYNSDAVLTLYKDMSQRAKDTGHPEELNDLRQALGVIANNKSDEKLKEFLSIDEMTIDDAYRYLGTTSDAADDTIKALFELKKTELDEQESALGGGSDEKALRALYLIASKRFSFVLFTCYEFWLGTKYQESLDTTMSLDAAYELLGIDKSLSDDDIVAVWEIRAKDNPDDILELRKALRKIATEKDMPVVIKYLETGYTTSVDSHEDERDENYPVGLNNIGNTCYLNSLLQFYFTITPLRNAVLEFPHSSGKEDIQGMNKKQIVKKVGGRDVPVWEVARAQQFVILLGDLFTELVTSRRKSVTPTKDLAYLALVPATSAPEDELEIVIEEEDEDVHQEAKNQGSNDKKEDAHPEGVHPEGEEDFDSCGATNDDLFELKVVEREVLDTDTDTVESDVLEDDGHMSGMDLDADTLSKDSSLVYKKPRTSSSLLNEHSHDYSHTENTNTGDDIVMIDISDVPSSLPPRAERKRRSSTIALTTSKEEKIKRIDTALLGGQQDVTECIENVLFQIEAAVKGSGKDEADNEQVDIIKELFYGKTKQTLAAAVDGSHRREKIERFSSLLVDVAEGPRDLYDALDASFRESVFELEDGKTLRSMSILELPPILQIQVQRVQFDRTLNQPFKSLARLDFDEVIYMDRYMDTDDNSIIKKRRELNSWRRELKEVKAKYEEMGKRSTNGLTVKDSLTTLIEWFENLEESSELKPDQNTLDVLKDQAQQYDLNINLLKEKQTDLEHKIKTQFGDMKSQGYRIHSVFIHKGQASFGHYWIYIYDKKRRSFLKYNDETITEVTDDEVFDKFDQAASSTNATPYFLVYVKNSVFEEYTESIVRGPEPQEQEHTVPELVEIDA